MEDTYLYLIPTEIFDIILLNLNVKDIISVLGPNFYESKIILCKNILFRDYGSRFSSKLLLKDIDVNEVDWVHYDNFIQKLKTYIKALTPVVGSSEIISGPVVHATVHVNLIRSLTLLEELKYLFSTTFINYHKQNIDKLVRFQCILHYFKEKLEESYIILDILPIYQLGDRFSYNPGLLTTIKISLEIAIYIILYHSEESVFS